MPTVQAKLALGGRHHSVFRDSLVQRSLLLRGTAAIKRVEAEEIDVDRLTVRSARTTLSAINDLAGGSNLVTENAVKDALDLVDTFSTTDFNSKVPLGSNTNYNETTTDDRYVRVLRWQNGIIGGFLPEIKLEQLSNVSDYAGQNNSLPSGVPGFLVWGGALGINQFIQFDMLTACPHAFTPHPVNASVNFQGRQVGDILVYRGGYTDPSYNAYNYQFTQPSFAGSVITSGTVDAARLPDLSVTYLTKEKASTTYLTQLQGDLLYMQNVTNLQASRITSGTFDAARIPDLSSTYLTSVPNLPASQITSGTLDTARIPDLSAAYLTPATASSTYLTQTQGDTRYLQSVPNLPASQITSGTFDAARIPDLSSTYLTSVPNLSASQITSGTLDTARIPDLSAAYVPIPASGSAAGRVVKRNSTNDGWVFGDASSTTSTDAALIANGTVSNTEFQHLNGVSSSIQTQLNALRALCLEEGLRYRRTSNTYSTSTASNLTLSTILNFFYGQTTATAAQHSNVSARRVYTVEIDQNDFGNNYSQCWHGFFTTLTSNSGFYSNTLRFRTTSDDGSHVYVDGTMVVNNGGNHGSQTRTSSAITTSLNQQHEIHIFHYEVSGDAEMKFEWYDGTSWTDQLSGSSVGKFECLRLPFSY
jgi:hypothetical protein